MSAEQPLVSELLDVRRGADAHLVLRRATLLDPVAGQPSGDGLAVAGWSVRSNNDLVAAGGAVLVAGAGLAVWRVRRTRRG